jgi:hypothetical protein
MDFSSIVMTLQELYGLIQDAKSLERGGLLY